MSICGNCHYNLHSEEECSYDCTFQDAVYREQGAYDALKENYDNLINWCNSNGIGLPIWIEPYTEVERHTRDNISPNLWTLRDWQDYYEQHKEAIESVEKISEALVKAGEVYLISAEEAAAALKIAGQKIIDNSGITKEILDNDNKI